MSGDAEGRGTSNARAGDGTLHRVAAALRERPLALPGVLLALFGLDVVDGLLPSAEGLGGAGTWAVAFGPQWLVAGLVVALVLWGERRPLGSIGLTRPDPRDLALGVVGFVVGVATFLVTEPIVEALGLGTTQSGIGAISALPLAGVVALAVTAGITEEVLYRGYPIERLSELTGSLRLGAGLTVLTFTVAHVPFWGLGGALQIGAWTLVVTVLYVRTRNLPACMLMHVANDLFAFVVVPMLQG